MSTLPFQNAAAVVLKASLTSVRFLDFSAQHVPPKTASDDLPEKLRFSTRFLRPTTVREEQSLTAVTTFVFRMAAVRSEEEEETVATIRASLMLEYRLKDDADITEAQLADFVLCYVPFHSWGYWREFIHSSLARLELPGTTIPLFRISMAPNLVIDRVD